MAIPKFTAEASLGPTTQVYRVHDRFGAAETAQIFPQLNGEAWEEGLGDEEFGDQGFEEGMEMGAEDEVEGMEMGAEDEVEGMEMGAEDEVEIAGENLK